MVANVLYYTEDNAEVFNLAGGKKIGIVVPTDQLPNAGDVRLLLECAPDTPIDRPVYLECPVCHGDFDTEDLLLLHWERQHNVETDVRIFVEDCLIREPEGGVVGIYKFRSLF